ncbi:ABC transporter permease [Caldalkalibacillus salinus]|uniref:ABC transporter permease n=1 Tax=Caldalkalibacillus salinus TaxID=2803787 RepID=UPI0019212A50|nr:ABC transporter permease [Caldalkalibacillus salinus]
MSYELYFVQRSPNKIRKEKLLSFFQSNLWQVDTRAEQRDAFEVIYKNPLSKTTFQLNILDNNPGEQKEDGFYFSGILFSVEYAKPTFFAYEAMLILEEVCQAFDLYVINPQDYEIGGDSKPKNMNADAFTASWKENNKIKIHNVYEEMGVTLPYLPEDIGMAIWQYHLNKRTVTDRLGPAYVAPDYLFYQEHRSGVVKRAIAWTEWQAMVFPPCDYIIISQSLDYISYQALRESFGDYLQKINGPIDPLYTFNLQYADDVQRIYENLKPSGQLIHTHKKVMLSECVDVPDERKIHNEAAGTLDTHASSQQPKGKTTNQFFKQYRQSHTGENSENEEKQTTSSTKSKKGHDADNMNSSDVLEKNAAFSRENDVVLKRQTVKIKDLTFSSFVKWNIFLLLFIGILAGLITFGLSYMFSEQFNVTVLSMTFDSMTVGIASIFVIPLLFMILGFIASIILYVPLWLGLRVVNGLRLKGAFEIEPEI